MEKYLAFLKDHEADTERIEWFRYQNHDLKIVHDRKQFLQLLRSGNHGHIILELKRLSDIMLLQSVHNMNPETDVTVLVEPRLKAIFDTIQNCPYSIVQSEHELRIKQTHDKHSMHGGNDA